MATTKIRLGKQDAALVFRGDGIAEAFFPHALPSNEQGAQNVMCAHALFWAFNDDDMMTTIADALRASPSRMN